MNIPLIQLRDILADWAYSPALNAARAYEVRQIYWAHDSRLGKRVVPYGLGVQVQQTEEAALAADLNYVHVFHVQLKTLAPEYQDQWSDKTYAVLWPVNGWLESAEYKHTASEEAINRRRAYDLKIRAESRLTRMVSRFVAAACCGEKPAPNMLKAAAAITAALQGADSEDSIRAIIFALEKAINRPIYEDPKVSD